LEETKKFKASRYNHFVPAENGKRLAFNALSCGLAEMDDESYEVYEALAGGDGDQIDREKNADLIENLKKGGFLIDPELDELAAIRAAHYRSRFGNRGFGLTLIPTLQCNFACDYCYEDSKIRSTPADRGGVMSDEVCDNVVRLCEQRVEPKGSFGVTWYGGEPLLAPHIIETLSEEFIRICNEKEADFHAGIITNGYLLNQKNLELLRRCRVSFAQVTIDGPREIHDQRRCLKGGGGTFDRIMDNLASLPEDSGIRIAIRINVDKRNENRIPDLLADFKRRGFHKRKDISLSFGQVFQAGGSCPDISTSCLATSEFSAFLADAYATAIDMGFRHASYPARQFGCGAVGTSSAVIEPTGTVQNCWETVGHDEKRTGILRPEGIAYENNYTKWLGWTPFNGECLTCGLLPLCTGGCPHRSLYLTDIDNCVSWKYNLSLVLPLVRLARERHLLAAQLDSRVASDRASTVDHQ